jgi:hypothetical protein
MEFGSATRAVEQSTCMSHIGRLGTVVSRCREVTNYFTRRSPRLGDGSKSHRFLAVAIVKVALRNPGSRSAHKGDSEVVRRGYLQGNSRRRWGVQALRARIHNSTRTYFGFSFNLETATRLSSHPDRAIISSFSVAIGDKFLFSM